jgi:hypothetical protein
MILVPLFDLEFLIEIAASGAGTSNRRHWNCLAAGQRVLVNPAIPLLQVFFALRNEGAIHRRLRRCRLSGGAPVLSCREH